MKKTCLMLLLALLCACPGYSQTFSKFFVRIPDAAYIPTVSPGSGRTVNVTFRQAGLNAIKAGYQFRRFSKAYANSRYPMMRQVYAVEVSSPQFIADIKALFPAIFGYAQPVPEVRYQYLPNDYYLPAVLTHIPWHLQQIDAKNAWDVKKGTYNNDQDTVVIGIVDEYVNPAHEDLAGKFKLLRANILYPFKSDKHGTGVSGLLAGKTDNSLGLASIGFNCKLDFSTAEYDQDSVFLQMSKDGRRVLNGSFIESFRSSPYIYDHNIQFWEQSTYDEIYENGTIACFAAGNGDVDRAYPQVPSYYEFPASFNHNISVTGVGCQPPAAGSIYDMDLFKFPGVTRTYNYNDRVDMAAAGYDVPVLWNDATAKYSYMQEAGTSSASPIVAGTLGLMVAAKQALSPYQLEYILKTTGTPIDGIPINAPYAGKIGKRVDAFKAVTRAAGYNEYEPATQTMYIEGIEMSNRCSPAIGSNAPKPKLRAHVKNGYGNLRYCWESTQLGLYIGGGLDDSTLAEPTIVSPVTSVSYKLTVYDESPVQKVASKFFSAELITDPAKYDLAMHDSYADMLEEPNKMAMRDPRDWQLWQSPDIWNRQLQDGDSTHENPEYFNSNPNFLYVRVRNVGCAVSPSANAKLRLYWTQASTSEKWKTDWINGTGANPATGKEITSDSAVTVPPLQPGQAVTLVRAWTPPKPQDYNSQQQIDACVLARIETSPTAPYGIIPAEYIDSNVKYNVLRSNNIVTRNLIVTNYNTANRGTDHIVGFGNAGAQARVFSLQVLNNKDIFRHFAGNLSDYIYAVVHLDEDLFNRWTEGGRQGQYGGFDEGAHTFIYDPATPLRLDNITLEANTKNEVAIDFVMKDGVEIPFDITDQEIHVRELTMSPADTTGMGYGAEDIAPFEEEVYGNVSFGFSIAANSNNDGTPRGRGTQGILASKKTYSIYPNPANTSLNISQAGGTGTASVLITDVLGRIVFTNNNIILSTAPYTINTAAFASGLYFVKVASVDGSSIIEKIAIKR